MNPTKNCPACKKEIGNVEAKCPHCQKQLRTICWEIDRGNGETMVIGGEQTTKSVGECLLQGTISLSDRCRQYIQVLKNIDDGKEEVEIERETPWYTVQNFTDQIFDLQVLYSPVQAHIRYQIKNITSFVQFLCITSLVIYGLIKFWSGFSLSGLLYLAACIVGLVAGGAMIGKFLGALLAIPIGGYIGLTKKKLLR